MTDDRLLRDLGRLANEETMAEQARLDARWDRMAAGTLTAEEEAELRALAETSPEARAAFEAFRPLGPEFQARMTESIAAELDKTSAAPEPQPSPSRILPFRPAFFRFTGWLTAAAAAAGVLFLLLRSPASMPPLPAYTAELSGGVKTFRGEPLPSAEPPAFQPGSTLTLVFRPQHPVTGEVESRFFLSRADGGDLAPWEPEGGLEMANGVVRFRGTLGREIELQTGSWTIWMVACRPGKVPPASVLQAALRAGRNQTGGCQAASAELVVKARASP